MNENQLKYPIGNFNKPGSWPTDALQSWIQDIRLLPGLLYTIVSSFNERLLNTPYRTGGWTGRQVVHHIADSHLNSYIRFKLALTEEKPTIKPYNEQKWSELADYSSSVYPTLRLIQSLHERWSLLLESLDPQDFDRSFIHPENGQIWTLGQNTALYAWHGKHHLGHLELIKNN